MNDVERDKLIKRDMNSIENIVRHAFNQGYDMGYISGKAAKQGHWIEHKLDKIRDEIENYNDFILCANGQKGIHIDAALEIIDKYKEKDI